MKLFVCLSLWLLAILLLANCAPKPYWKGFHGPAYLPAKPHAQPSVQQFDSTAAASWAPRLALFRP